MRWHRDENSTLTCPNCYSIFFSFFYRNSPSSSASSSSFFFCFYLDKSSSPRTHYQFHSNFCEQSRRYLDRLWLDVLSLEVHLHVPVSLSPRRSIECRSLRGSCKLISLASPYPIRSTFDSILCSVTIDSFFASDFPHSIWISLCTNCLRFQFYVHYSSTIEWNFMQRRFLQGPWLHLIPISQGRDSLLLNQISLVRRVSESTVPMIP